MGFAAIIAKKDAMARRGYPPGFRRPVVESVEGGRQVAEVAADLGIGD
jgi:transposase-like protein